MGDSDPDAGILGEYYGAAYRAQLVTQAKTAVVWGSEEPVVSVGCCEPMWPGDSGLTFIYTDAPDPQEVEPDDPRITLVHVDCLVSDDPGLAAGIAIAREYQVADLDDDGEWIVGDVTRLSPSG